MTQTERTTAAAEALINSTAAATAECARLRAEVERLRAEVEQLLASVESAIPHGWAVRRNAPLPYLTDEANAAAAWVVTRTEPPYSKPAQGPRCMDISIWTGPSLHAALRAGCADLGLAQLDGKTSNLPSQAI